jgi:lipid-A-disaccharide synthase-like uncharacterized protein
MKNVNVKQEIYARKREALKTINRSLIYIFFWYLPLLGLSVSNLLFLNTYHSKFMLVSGLILIGIWITLIIYRSIKTYNAKQELKKLNSSEFINSIFTS